jgi:hypothetical protein
VGWVNRQVCMCQCFLATLSIETISEEQKISYLLGWLTNPASHNILSLVMCTIPVSITLSVTYRFHTDGPKFHLLYIVLGLISSQLFNQVDGENVELLSNLHYLFLSK